MTTVQVVKVMNEGDIRRKALLDLLKTGDGPVSGSTLSGKLGVSRQVIVQDIALLRAANKEIFATPKGLYFVYTGAGKKIPAHIYGESYL